MQGGSTALGRLRLGLSELARERGKTLQTALPSCFVLFTGDFVIDKGPHFLWITEFPLFTRADEDKDFLARGRWSSTHHPFTAPMWEDINALYHRDVEVVRSTSAPRQCPHPCIAISIILPTVRLVANLANRLEGNIMI